MKANIENIVHKVTGTLVNAAKHSNMLPNKTSKVKIKSTDVREYQINQGLMLSVRSNENCFTGLKQTVKYYIPVYLIKK